MNLVLIETDNNSRAKAEASDSFKSMMRNKGKFFIERMIRIGRINGVTSVFCITNSDHPELEKYLSKDNIDIPAKLIVTDLGNPMDVLFALASVHNKEPMLLTDMNCVFLDNEFNEFVTYALLQGDADGTIGITKNINAEKPLCVAMNDEDIILKFNDSKEGYSWKDGGIYFFSPQILTEASYALDTGISEIGKFLQLLISRRYILKGFSFSRIVRVENADDIVEAENLIRKNKL